MCSHLFFFILVFGTSKKMECIFYIALMRIIVLLMSKK
jgi:hypothetical protein